MPTVPLRGTTNAKRLRESERPADRRGRSRRVVPRIETIAELSDWDDHVSANAVAAAQPRAASAAGRRARDARDLGRVPVGFHSSRTGARISLPRKTASPIAAAAPARRARHWPLQALGFPAPGTPRIGGDPRQSTPPHVHRTPPITLQVARFCSAGFLHRTQEVAGGEQFSASALSDRTNPRVSALVPEPVPTSRRPRLAPNTKKPRNVQGFSTRVSDGTRTRDRLDHNQELYQLSYAHHGPTAV
jgi:hypothetical protein